MKTLICVAWLWAMLVALTVRVRQGAQVAARSSVTRINGTHHFARQGLAMLAMVLAMVPLLAPLLAPVSASAILLRDPWREGLRPLYFEDKKLAAGLEVSSGKVYYIQDDSDEGVGLPVNVPITSEIMEEAGMALVLSQERANLFLSEDAAAVDYGGATSLHYDGRETIVGDNGFVEISLLEDIFYGDIAVIGVGYVNLEEVCHSVGAVFRTDKTDNQGFLVNWIDPYYPERLVLDNSAVENDAGVYVQCGEVVLTPQFSRGHGLTNAAVVQWDNWAGDVTVYIRTSPDVPEPISVHIHEDGMEDGLLWGENPTKPFLVRKHGATTTMLPATSLLEATGPYNSKEYVRNPDGPDMAVYQGWRGHEVKVFIDTTTVVIDETAHYLPGTSFVLKGTTMVHIRIAELLPGVEIYWGGRLSNGLGIVDLYTVSNP